MWRFNDFPTAVPRTLSYLAAVEAGMVFRTRALPWPLFPLRIP